MEIVMAQQMYKQDNKSDEGDSNELSTPKTTNVSSKKDDSNSVNVRFSDSGNGSFNYRLSTAAEETSKEGDTLEKHLYLQPILVMKLKFLHML